MKQRDLVMVLGALALAVGVSAILFVGAATNTPPEAAAPRVFFEPRGTSLPARPIAQTQDRAQQVPPPFQLVVPLQRGVSDASRDAAGFLLVLLATAGTLVLAHDQVVNAYRASLGGWRAHLRVFTAGLAVLGVGASALALGWVVFLGFVAGTLRGGPFGLQAGLQLGLAVFGVLTVIALLATLVGFAAAAWRLGDAILRLRFLSRLQSSVPSPLVALVGATIIYLAWQIPAAGVFALAAVVAYSLGAVVTARLMMEGARGNAG